MNNLLVYKPNEFAKKIGVDVKTLQNWDNEGILKAFRSPTNRRYYTEEHYKKYVKNLYADSFDEKSLIDFKIILRLREENNDFIVDIQHIKTKEYIEIKRLKTYKNAMSTVKRKKEEYEQIGITVDIIKQKKIEGGNK